MQVEKQSKPNKTHGGRRSGAGRRHGSKSRVSREVRDYAREFTLEAVKELARLAFHAESEQVRVAAIRELLDRGHGKATQQVEIEADIRQYDTSAEPLTDAEWERQYGMAH
jgi:hypothetical protein